MQNIYYVYGECGEYSDSCLWNVKAFTTKKKARMFRDFLCTQLECLSGNKTSREIYYSSRLDALCKEMKRHDPDFSFDYTGTTYDVGTMVLGD